MSERLAEVVTGRRLPDREPGELIQFSSGTTGAPKGVRLGGRAIASPLLFGWATEGELEKIPALALKVNDVLRRFLDGRGIILVDFKLEFGRHKGEILLGDEICPDTCRFWDKATRKKLDKDRFRRDLGEVEDAYQEMLRRVEE